MLIEFEGLAITGKLAERLSMATSMPSLCSTTSTRTIATATTTTTARLAMSLGMVLPPFLVRLKIGIKERLVGRLGAITAVVTWFAAVEAASMLPGRYRSIEDRWWARIFDPGTRGMHLMVGSESKLSDAVKGRSVDNRRTDGVGLNLFGGFKQTNGNLI